MKYRKSKGKPQRHVVSVTHNYPALPAVNERVIEVVGSLSSALNANADAIKQNAIALQKIADMATQLGHPSISIEASAFTAKTNGCMNVSDAEISIAPGEYRSPMFNTKA